MQTRRPVSLRRILPVAFSLLTFTSAACLSAQPPPVQNEEPIISLKLNNVTLQDALETLAKKANVKIVLAKDVKPIMLTLDTELPLRQTLDMVLKSTGMPFKYTVKENVYTVEVDKTPPVPKPDDERVLSLDLTNTDVAAALKLLMRQARLQYKIDADVPHTKITLHVEKMTALKAITEMTRLSGSGFTYKVENGIYHFSGAKPVHP